MDRVTIRGVLGEVHLQNAMPRDNYGGLLQTDLEILRTPKMQDFLLAILEASTLDIR
jgi:hypothetical protein